MDTIILVIIAIILCETSFLTYMKYKQRHLKVARGSLLLDTSAIMDGRIVDVAKSGIVSAELIIPRSVVNEMQLLADKSDHEKRARARKGLENIRELQKIDSVSVAIVNDGVVDSGGVDARLLELAKRYDAGICTTDYNLNKVAKVVDIVVVNVNELAQMLRVVHLPGERIDITLSQIGQNRNQGVGYLDDGTMVVVEDAKENIGQRVKVEIIRSLQTEAGRMMFAKKVEKTVAKKPQSKGENSPRRTQQPAVAKVEARVEKAPAKVAENKSSTTRRNNYRRRRSPEDSLVELANKQD